LAIASLATGEEFANAIVWARDLSAIVTVAVDGDRSVPPAETPVRWNVNVSDGSSRVS
jgi:hypothetical protein